MHYINELTPELAAELKELTPKCEELFGKFPVSIDRESFGFWFYEPDDDEEQRQLWWKIGNTFRDCIWKESRERSLVGWLDYLRENDDELKQIHQIEENIDKEIFDYVESLPEEKLNSLREIFASDYTIPKESINIQNLRFSLWRVQTNWLFENDENYRKQMDLKYSKLEPLTQFQNDFDSLLKKFCLEKEWLAESVFRAIWNGTGKLQMEASFMEDIPGEVTIEIESKLKITPPNHLFDRDSIPLPNPFRYQERYWIYFPFDYYEEKAVEAYRKHLHDYFKIIKESLKKHGYKEPQGDKYDYERVKWLVLWNINPLTKDELLQEIADTTGNFFDASTIDKAFRNFKKYDLPVRRATRKRN